MRGDGVHSGRVYSIVEDLFSTLYVGMQPELGSVVFASPEDGISWYSPDTFECLCLLRASDGAIYAGTAPNGDVFKYIPLPPTQIKHDQIFASCQYNISQNYPNPFNSTTCITFYLPESQHTVLKIYNAQEIKTLIDEFQSAGNYTVTWDGVDEQGKLRLREFIFIAANQFCRSRNILDLN